MKQGFTLVELLIAIGIFAIFIVIITGVFGRFVDVERHGIAQGQLVVDIQSAMEAFIKEARTGYGSTYFVNDDGDGIAFRNQENRCVMYRLTAEGVFERGEDEAPGEDCTPETLGQSRFTPITGKDTDVVDLAFIPSNTSGQEVDGRLMWQGVISIEMKVKSKQSEDIPAIEIHNTVTSRQMSPYIPL